METKVRRQFVNNINGQLIVLYSPARHPRETCPTTTAGEAGCQSDFVLDREATESDGAQCSAAKAQEGQLTPASCRVVPPWRRSYCACQATQLRSTSCRQREAFQPLVQFGFVQLEWLRFGVVGLRLVGHVGEQARKTGIEQAARQNGVREEELVKDFRWVSIGWRTTFNRRRL